MAGRHHHYRGGGQTRGGRGGSEGGRGGHGARSHGDYGHPGMDGGFSDDYLAGVQMGMNMAYGQAPPPPGLGQMPPHPAWTQSSVGPASRQPVPQSAPQEGAGRRRRKRKAGQEGQNMPKRQRKPETEPAESVEEENGKTTSSIDDSGEPERPPSVLAEDLVRVTGWIPEDDDPRWRWFPNSEPLVEHADDARDGKHFPAFMSWASALSPEIVRCGNCGQPGHVVAECTSISASGYTYGCTICNARHSTSRCKQFPGEDDLEGRVYLLVTQRANKPPLKGLFWYPIMCKYMQENPTATVNGLPWTLEFGKTAYGDLGLYRTISSAMAQESVARRPVDTKTRSWEAAQATYADMPQRQKQARGPRDQDLCEPDQAANAELPQMPLDGGERDHLELNEAEMPRMNESLADGRSIPGHERRSWPQPESHAHKSSLFEVLGSHAGRHTRLLEAKSKARRALQHQSIPHQTTRATSSQRVV
ncbi:hypothetical protein NM208_g10529 [Fusarium decemcellulare]|uniref:Uncharacterized protein n=1 Tax=Fusarium decemcellulare TaxID=57161 RepID=A0ACC1RXL0_9HYPO|nr:hypothetical protein NM208_g10529 [Fusarium decemcellulare]